MSQDESEKGTLTIIGEPWVLFENLAKAQAEFLPVPEDAKGQVGNNRTFKYADYATIIRCIRPALTKYGLAFLQPLHTEGDLAVSTSILAGHGALIQSSLRFEHDGNPQEFGRVHTYHRRYQLLAFFGIEGEDADDARRTPAPPAPQFVDKAPKSEPKNEPPKAAEKQPEAPKANGVAESPKPPPVIDATTMNDILEKGRKQLGWQMSDVRAFYVEHLDKTFKGKLIDLPVTAKRALHAKLVELKGVEPF